MNSITKVKKLVTLLKSRRRQKAIEIIKETPGITMTEIRIKMRIDSQAEVSGILKVLRESGAVYSQKDGKYRKYYYNKPISELIEKVTESINELSKEIDSFNLR